MVLLHPSIELRDLLCLVVDDLLCEFLQLLVLRFLQSHFRHLDRAFVVMDHRVDELQVIGLARRVRV